METIVIPRTETRPGSDDAKVDFLWELYQSQPLLLTEAQLDVLRKKGKILSQREAKEDIDEAVRLALESRSNDDRYVLSIEQYLDRCPQEWRDEWKDRDIMSRDWIPKEPGEMDPDFVKFISSHHKRFCDLEPHKPFFLYLMHEKRMSEENLWAHMFPDDYTYNQFIDKEFARIKVHTGYFGNKYAKIKDGSILGGERKWKGNLSLMFILFLVDSGRSFYATKARQIAFTSTIGLALICKALTRKNLIIKFVAQSEAKSMEIFRDKFKPTMEMLPDIWGVPSIPNDREKLLRVSFAEPGKGNRNKAVSTIEVIAPRADAINGGGPDIVAMDEMAFTPLFKKMVKEARPTRFAHDEETGKLKLRRQVMAWSTGGEDAKGAGSYEMEYRSTLAKWYKNDFSDMVVPIFLDWTCRIGISVEFYNKEFRAYATGTNEGVSDKSIEENMIEFRQHYPSSVDDCFLASRDTLIPVSVIKNNIDKIHRKSHTALIEYNEPLVTKGSFTPIYNMSVPMQEGAYFTHQVIGANFTASSDNDHHAPVMIFQHPRKRVINTYFKGTDPVEAENTTSKHSSVVWDARYGTIPAISNQRTSDPMRCFEQSALLNLYYSPPGEFIPELIENNIGRSYINFLSDQHFSYGRKAVVGMWQLPEYMRTKTAIEDGINVKGNVRLQVINQLLNMLQVHGDKIYLLELWEQLLHFVPSGGEIKRYRSEDTNKFNDDVLLASAFAYICRMCFGNRMPESLEDRDRSGPILVEELLRDHNGQLYYGINPISTKDRDRERIRQLSVLEKQLI